MIAVIDEIYNRMVHRPCARLGLRIFFIALKETKTISALNNIMKIIDSSKESFWRSKKNTKFDDYKHVCALPSHISGNTLYGLVEEITIYLIILAKFTPLLKECFNYTNFSLEKLMGNDSILSIGALIVQLAAISDTHTFSAERRPAACDHPLHTPSISGGVGCCTLSIAYGVKTSLTCRSCAPNARRCIIEDNRIILYALQPIKKGAQITEGQPSITNGITKQARQAFYKERTGRDCDCPVCEDDWPVMNCMDLFFKEDPTLSLKGIEVLNEIKVLSDKIELRDKICLEARTIKKFSKVVKEALEHAPLPSKLATLAILHLTLLVEITHGFSKSIIPDKCGSDCHCQACEEDWPVMNLLKTPFHGFGNLSPRSHKVLHEIWAVYGDIHSHFFSQDILSNKKILKFSKIVEEMVVDSPLPSKIAALAINCLAGLVDAAYGFHKPQVPHECGQ
ncbi:hypothetical protein QAD02_010079 [Eretmocerus hayati]|uniref:Uncharacterized protein n=1 Tax=Eretmocerus hayati TaxID=131215 RepID=A0ACC2NBX9_9HYME|nr:hypothetical protein QAD02_010079 [Eretmocerus hayati]